MGGIDEWAIPDLVLVRDVLRVAERRWWVAGGIALDLFLGYETRPHHDVDIAVLDRDAEVFREALAGWEVAAAIGWEGAPQCSRRVLDPWVLGEASPGASAYWCRPRGSTAWVFELLLNPSSGESWHFKRDHAISRSIEGIGAKTKEGVPYLTPEIVLLHKATSDDFDAQDTMDLQMTWPVMTEVQREWLIENLERLHPDHEWLATGTLAR